MGFRKAVVAEALDLVEQLLGKILLVATSQHTVHQLLAIRLQPTLAFPGRHGASQLIGLTAGETCGHHGQLHHLLLENRYAQGAFQRIFNRFARIAHRLFAATAVQERMHHISLNRARSHNCYLNHQIIITARLQARQHTHLGPRLDLEYTDGICLTHHVVNFRVFRRDLLHGESFFTVAAYQAQTFLHRGQHAQRQHVDLQQAQ